MMLRNLRSLHTDTPRLKPVVLLLAALRCLMTGSSAFQKSQGYVTQLLSTCSEASGGFLHVLE